MANIKKTPLNTEQINHLEALLDTNANVKVANLCEIEGLVIKYIDIEMANGNKETFYPDDETLDFILNGIKLTRNAK